ncbi:MAG: hypothetical protein AAB317_03630 [Nitrospirota bacterium]
MIKKAAQKENLSYWLVKTSESSNDPSGQSKKQQNENPTGLQRLISKRRFNIREEENGDLD